MDHRTKEKRLSAYSHSSDRSKGSDYYVSDDNFTPSEKWLKQSNFLIVTIGYLVGLGNIWRFPYICYKNGGGAFLIPYFFCVLVIGIPLCVLEIAIGQFTSLGLYNNFDFIPAFKGVGVSCAVIALFSSYHYNVLISWTIYYIIASVQPELPWSKCGNWSSQLCETKLSKVDNFTCLKNPSLVLYPNGTCYNKTSKTLYGISDKALAKSYGIKAHLPAQDYLRTKLLFKGITKADEGIGRLRWDLSLCLMVAWVMVFFCLVSGIYTSSRFIRFVMAFAFIILVFLFIYGIMQDGSSDGIQRYMKVNATKLREPQVWTEAMFHVLVSIGPLTGIISVLASKNDFHANLIRDGIFASMIDTLVSVYAGFVVFNFIGSFAKSRGVDVEEMVAPGIELLFVVFPQACASFPASSVLSFLFFFMLAFLGMGSELPYVYTSVALITDISSTLKEYKVYLTAFLCTFLYLVGLFAATEGGNRIINFFNEYTYNWNAVVLMAFYCVSVIIYGPLRITNDIDIMLGDASSSPFFLSWKHLKWWFISCWSVIIPIFSVILLILKIVKETELNKSGTEAFIAIFETALTLIPIPIVFAIEFVRVQGKPTVIQRIRSLFTPSITWGPYLTKHRRLVTYVHRFCLNPRNLPDDKERSKS